MAAASESRLPDNRDLCSICSLGGELLCCDSCPRACHLQCTGLRQVPKGSWRCAACTADKSSSKNVSERPKVELESRSLNGHGSFATLGRLMQHLELVVPLPLFSKAALVVLDLDPNRPRLQAAPALDVVAALHKVAEIVGPDVLLNAVRAVEAGAALAYGLGSLGGPGQLCTSCGYYKVTRTICLQCGTSVVDARGNDLQIGLAHEELEGSGKALPRPSAKEIEAAARRGVQYFGQCLEEVKGLYTFSGDMLFLAQKLIGVVRGNPELQQLSTAIFEATAVRFCKSHIHLDPDRMEDNHFTLDAIEGLHALRKRSFYPAIQADLLPAKPSRETAAEGNTAPAQPTGTRLSTRVKMARPLEEIFDYEILADEIKASLRQFDLSEVLGFDPSERKLPMTPLRCCSHCGRDNRAKITQCEGCGCQLRCKVDYGSLTDASVWSYVFSNVGFDLECQLMSREVSFCFEEVLRLLPDARSYHDLDELGSDLFKLQSYFASHFIYIMSDWGSHLLRRELYVEEFRYFAENLRRVINMQDAELIGEFLHCLRVLGMDPNKPNSEDPLLEMAYWDGVARLVLMEKDGSWTAPSSATYARYHSAWCGVVGLMGTEAFIGMTPVAFVGRLGEVKPTI